jgi:hypothetical protein
MTNEVERVWKEAVVAYFKALSLEGLRKITKTVSQDKRCRDLHSQYELKRVTVESTRSVVRLVKHCGMKTYGGVEV